MRSLVKTVVVCALGAEGCDVWKKAGEGRYRLEGWLRIPALKYVG